MVRRTLTTRPTRGQLFVTGIAALVVASAVVAGAVSLDATARGGADAAAPVQAQSQPSGFNDTVPLGDADTELIGESVDDTAGWAVSNAGDVNGDGVADLVVGAPRSDTGGENAGAAYVFYGPVESGTVDLSEADLTLVGADEGDVAGWSVSDAGDLNGDGYADVIVGAPGNDTGGENAGAAYVVYGGDSLPGTMSLADADATLRGNEANDTAGWSVGNATGEDFDGVVVGVPQDDEGGTNAGAAYLVAAESLPGTLDLDSEADAKFVGEAARDHAGWAVSNAGDVNGNGVGNVLVGAPLFDGADGETPDAGAAYIANTTAATESGDDAPTAIGLGSTGLTYAGATANDTAGLSVAPAGDVNNDSLPDVLVGAPGTDQGGENAGAAYVVHGDEDLLAGDSHRDLSNANLRLHGEAAGDRAGWSVSAAGSGDVTCDSVADVLVGAPGTDSTAPDAGAAYLVAGGADLGGDVNLSDAAATFVGEGASDQAGHAVSEAGDLNDDGFEDVAIGAPYHDTKTGENAGAAYVLFADCRAPTETPTKTPTETRTETKTETKTPTKTKTETETKTKTKTKTKAKTKTETKTPTKTKTKAKTKVETKTKTKTETDTKTDTKTKTKTETKTPKPTTEPDQRESKTPRTDTPETTTSDSETPDDDEKTDETPDDDEKTDETPDETPEDGTSDTETSGTDTDMRGTDGSEERPAASP